MFGAEFCLGQKVTAVNAGRCLFVATFSHDVLVTTKNSTFLNKISLKSTVMVRMRNPEDCWINPYGPLGRPESMILDEVDPPPYFNRYTAIFVAWGVLAAAVGNIMKRRPYYAGIQRHMLYGSLGAAAAWYVCKAENNRTARRDLIIEDYIRKHPEDFKTERKSWNDVLIPWSPVR